MSCSSIIWIQIFMGYEFVKPPGGTGLKEVRFGIEGRKDSGDLQLYHNYGSILRDLVVQVSRSKIWKW